MAFPFSPIQIANASERRFIATLTLSALAAANAGLLFAMLILMALAPDHRLILDSNIFGEALWEPWAYAGIVAVVVALGYWLVRDAWRCIIATPDLDRRPPARMAALVLLALACCVAMAGPREVTA